MAWSSLLNIKANELCTKNEIIFPYTLIFQIKKFKIKITKLKISMLGLEDV